MLWNHSFSIRVSRRDFLSWYFLTSTFSLILLTVFFWNEEKQFIFHWRMKMKPFGLLRFEPPTFRKRTKSFPRLRWKRKAASSFRERYRINFRTRCLRFLTHTKSRWFKLWERLVEQSTSILHTRRTLPHGSSNDDFCSFQPSFSLWFWVKSFSIARRCSRRQAWRMNWIFHRPTIHHHTV